MKIMSRREREREREEREREEREILHTGQPLIL